MNMKIDYDQPVPSTQDKSAPQERMLMNFIQSTHRTMTITLEEDDKNEIANYTQRLHFLKRTKKLPLVIRRNNKQIYIVKVAEYTPTKK